MFVREVGMTEVERMNINTLDGHTCVRFTNWLFTSLRKVPEAIHVPFDSNEDANGHMQAVVDKGIDLVCSEDNMVEYFTLDCSS